MTAIAATVAQVVHIAGWDDIRRLSPDPDRFNQAAEVAVTALTLLAAWLAVIIVLNLVTVRVKSPRFKTWVGAITPRFVAVLLTASVIGVSPAAANHGNTPAPKGPGVSDTTERPDVPVMELITPPTDTRTWLPWATEIQESPEGHSSSQGQTVATSYVVQPGDHLWSIASMALARSGGDSPGGGGQESVVAGEDRFDPTEAQITRYWLALISANRARLVDPDNPDLILPGQTLTLPLIAPMGATTHEESTGEVQ